MQDFWDNLHIKIVTQVEEGNKKFWKLKKCDIWIDFCVTKEKIPLHQWFIFRIDRAMGLWNFGFCQKIEILTKLKKGINSSKKLEENEILGTFGDGKEKSSSFTDGLFSKLMEHCAFETLENLFKNYEKHLFLKIWIFGPITISRTYCTHLDRLKLKN